MPPLLVVEVELVRQPGLGLGLGSEGLQVRPKGDLYCMLLGKPIQLHLGYNVSASPNFLGGHDSCFASQSPRLVSPPSSNNLMTTSFHAKPKHSFGPVAQQGCQLPCKLVQTDLYLNTATLLWYHKHDLLYSLVRNHWGYRRKWDAFFSHDNTKTFGMQHKLPLREFYEWLHEYWYDATTPIRCCHAIFILFIEVADKGKRSIEEIAHRPIYFPLNVSFADVAPSQEARD